MNDTNQLNTLLSEATAWLESQEWEKAALTLEKAFVAAENATQKTHIAGQLGAYYFSNKNFEKAAHWFGQCTQLSPEHAALWFDLGRACEAQGDWESAWQAWREAISRSKKGEYFLHAGAALYELGRKDEALQVWSLGDEYDPMLRHAQFHPQADEALKIKSKLADQSLRAHFSQLHRQSVAESLPRIHRAIWSQTHDQAFAFEHDKQRPHFFYLPDLPSIPVFKRDDLLWCRVLEKNFSAIRDEYLHAQKSELASAPYVHGSANLTGEWEALKGTNAWTSIHLYKDGKPIDANASKFPTTLAALKDVPLVELENVPLEVFFSVLQPGAHIPPHFGLANSRMTVHLPLIVPQGCEIRVGDHSHHWQEGEIFAFDDSFEHEAWNNSAETRIVLIFEAWVPDLSAQECAAISHSFATRTAWLKARKIPQA